MSTPVGRRSNLLLITLLLAISILLEQFFIAPIFPFLGNLGSIRPMIVFLDIPLALPAIDMIPVSILFALFYQIAPSAGLTREHPSISSGARVWKALTGWWALMLLLLAAGGLFHLSQDYLPRSVSNGIDSFGVRADLTLPYPSGGLIHLHGSVVMLAFSALGIFFLNRRTATPALQPNTAAPIAEPRPAEILSSSVVSSTGTLISPTINEALATRHEHQHARYQPPVTAGATSAVATAAPATTAVTTPAAKPAQKPAQKPAAVAVAVATPPASKPTSPATETSPVSTTRSYVQRPAPRNTTIITPEPPPTCRLTTPPPIAVVMPRPIPGVGKMHPCYVIGGLKPSTNFKKQE